MAEPIIIERTFDAPVSKVWEAISDKNKMKHWYFELENFKPEVGFEFHFNGGPPEKVYTHLCKVTEVIPQKKLSYTWRYENYLGSSLLTFELFSEGEKTRLKLTHEGIESFPQDSKDFARESFTAGWKQIIGTSLKDYLESGK
jgi:uncharacterized protein YndB with AHSA1/START domain